MSELKLRPPKRKTTSRAFLCLRTASEGGPYNGKKKTSPRGAGSTPASGLAEGEPYKARRKAGGVKPPLQRQEKEVGPVIHIQIVRRKLAR